MIELYSIIIISNIILIGIFAISFTKPITIIINNKARDNKNRVWLSLIIGIDHLALMILSEILKKPDMIISCFMTMWFVLAIIFREISKNRWD